MLVYVFWDCRDDILPLSFCCVSLFLEICLRFLRFSSPAGGNKLQTCFLGSNSTFAAPSLRHRPHHYPHQEETEMPLQSQRWRNFCCCGWDFQWMQKMTKRTLTSDRYLCCCCNRNTHKAPQTTHICLGVFVLPSEKRNLLTCFELVC